MKSGLFVLIKDLPDNADLLPMINPISNTSAHSASEVTQQARPQPPPQAATGSAAPQDKVTLNSTGDKSVGDPDHDGK